MKSELGYGVSVPYFWALAPNYDLTTTGTYYSKQGFLGEAEWRHRLANGAYTIKLAGINQLDRHEFDNDDQLDRGSTTRGMIATTGAFRINPRWTYGWNAMVPSDKAFAYRYGIEGYDAYNITNQAYLTGLNGRNYFDVRLYQFLVQESWFNSNPNASQPKQPWVLPSLDYAYTPTQSVAGGELNFDVNLQALHRDREDGTTPIGLERAGYLSGVEGNDGRITAEAEWKRTFIADNGLVITPLLALRGDGMYVNSNSIGVTRSEAFRAMATAGLETRWPILFSSTSSTHVLEPTAQLFVRNNEPYAGEMPNEDAQSFVFDASSLFDRDKFSGYDRVEGGTRANLGVRYSGTFNNGWSLNGIAGQSFQLGGLNSFATADFVNAGAESGLESSRSDYVAMIGASRGAFNVTTGGRFDKESFEVRRVEVASTNTGKYGSLFVKYAFIDQQPTYGFEDDRHEVTLGGSAKMTPNWRLLGSGTYDIVSETLVKQTAALAYDDECFTYMMYYTREEPVTADGSQGDQTTTWGFNISFRTLGEIGKPVDIGGI